MISVDILRAMNEAMVKLARPSGTPSPYTQTGQVRRDSYKGDPGQAPGMPAGSKPVNVTPKTPTKPVVAKPATPPPPPKPPALNPRTHFSTGQRKFKMPKGYKAPDSLVGKGFKERAMYIQSKGLNPFQRTGKGGWQRNKEVAGMMSAWYKDFKNPSKPAPAPTPAPKAPNPVVDKIRNNPAATLVPPTKPKPAPKAGDSAKSPASGAGGTPSQINWALRTPLPEAAANTRAWDSYTSAVSPKAIELNARRTSIYNRNNTAPNLRRYLPVTMRQPGTRTLTDLLLNPQGQTPRIPRFSVVPSFLNTGDFRTVPTDQLQILRGANPNPNRTGSLTPFDRPAQ